MYETFAKVCKILKKKNKSEADSDFKLQKLTGFMVIYYYLFLKTVFVIMFSKIIEAKT